MRIGVLGTGVVGSAIGGKLVELGHEVRMGSREAGNEKGRAWSEAAGANASEGSFADAAAFGELVVNCTAGQHSLEALEQAGRDSLAGKVLVDVADPLDFSGGMPQRIAICNEDSLGERDSGGLPRHPGSQGAEHGHERGDGRTAAGPAATTRSSSAATTQPLRPRSAPCSRGIRVAGGVGSSTSAESRPRAAPRCTCRSGCASSGRSKPPTSTSQWSAPKPSTEARLGGPVHADRLW